MQRWPQVTLDRSLQRDQLQKLLRLHMVEAGSSREPRPVALPGRRETLAENNVMEDVMLEV